MLRNMIGFYEQAVHTVEATGGGIPWAKIRESMNDIMYKLTSMKFEDPANGEAVLVDRYRLLQKEIEERFRSLSD